MASMPSQLDPVCRVVVGGIDTHKDLHIATIVDTDAVVLGTESFSTTRAGYRSMLRWMRSFGDVRKVGVEETGSYGAGVTRHLTEAGIQVLEVDWPDRTDRRRRGKSDTLDASDEVIQLSKTQPSLGVLALVDIDPQLILWDPAKHPEFNIIADIGQTDTKVVYFGGDTYMEYLVGSGILRKSQVDGSFDGSPARFVASQGEIAQSGCH